MRTLDVHRGLTTLLGVAVAAFLVWIATQVGQGTTGRFWASMGIVAGAGLVLAASQLLGGWTKFGMPRFSLGVFLLAFLPTLIATVWIGLATQPGNGWQEGRLTSWSETLGINGFVQAIGLYHGVLAFAFGLVLGYCFDTRGRREEVVVAAEAAIPAPDDATVEPVAVAETEPALSSAGSAAGEGTHDETGEIE